MRLFLTSLALIATIIGLYFLQTFIAGKMESKSEEWEEETISGVHSYSINEPDQTLILHADLREISGLSMSKSDSFLLAVEDESGTIYYLDKRNGNIVRKIVFGKKGDYEGIESVNNDIFVTSSSGKIFRYDTLGQTESFKTPLKSAHDIEGLAFLPTSNVLLLACKSYGPDAEKHTRKIFSFNLSTHQLNADPLITFDSREISEKFGFKKKKPYFSPSGICLDQNNNLYILSSVAKAVIVMDTLGIIKSVAKLDPRLHQQPEGITIDKDGILYIANEAKNTEAKVFLFDPKT